MTALRQPTAAPYTPRVASELIHFFDPEAHLVVKRPAWRRYFQNTHVVNSALLFLDDVYVCDNRLPRFQRVKAPVKDELEDLVQSISQRVGRCLERRGLLEQDTQNARMVIFPTTRSG